MNKAAETFFCPLKKFLIGVSTEATFFLFLKTLTLRDKYQGSHTLSNYIFPIPLDGSFIGVV